MAAIKGIFESPTMATIWVKEATRRKLARSKVKNMEMSLQVSLHWQSVTWDCELLKPQVFFVILPNQAAAEEKEGEEDKEDLAKLFADPEHPVFLLVSVVWICFEQNSCGFLCFKIFLFFDASKRHQLWYTRCWIGGKLVALQHELTDIQCRQNPFLPIFRGRWRSVLVVIKGSLPPLKDCTFPSKSTCKLQSRYILCKRWNFT